MKNHLSLHDFKNWLSNHDGDECIKEFFNIEYVDTKNPYEKYVGYEVRPKVSESKLYDKAETEEDVDQLIYEFTQTGGTISETSGKMLTIETEIGQLILPRFCVKIKKPK